jgi:predicted RNase H-like HicB family nuclease
MPVENPLDQLALVWLLIGVPTAAVLVAKFWDDVKQRLRDKPPLTACTSVAAGTLVIAVAWPVFLALWVTHTFGLWLLRQPRVVRRLATKAAASATVHQEGDWFIARGTGVDVASQGRTKEEACANLREAVELHLTERWSRS